MLNDADILTHLKQELEPAALSAAIKRLRLVPEVWQALRVAEFLNDLLKYPDEIDWTPGSIADSCLMYQSHHPIGSADPAGPEDSPIDELFALATDAHDLAGKLNAGAESVMEALLSAPSAWVSRLVCAWPHVAQPASLIERMLSYQDLALTGLLITTLQANSSDAEFIEQIAEYGTAFAHFIPALMKNTQKDLALFLVEKMGEPGQEDLADSNAEMLAYAQALGGDFDGAHASLSSAWESATEATAKVADQLADVARLEGNQAVELEARRKALEEASTPLRRASLARALVGNAQPYDAGQIVSQPATIEERIAKGMALLSQGIRDVARQTLVQAKEEISQLAYRDPAWLGWLAEGLEGCGAVGEAIETKVLLTHLIPHEAALELQLAQLWEKSGDPTKAVHHAEIGLAIDPGSAAARRSLAHLLRQTGDPARALGYLKQITETDNSALIEYGECALEAGQPALAADIAAKLIESDPEAATAHVLIARAMHLQGEQEIARSAVERAIELNPECSEPWLILAEIQSEFGDDEAAGGSILKAMQLNPQDPRPHFARSQWLASRDRFHEANEHLTRAIELDPNTAVWLISHADILMKIGDPANAQIQLERALELQPNNWNAREKLALNLESVGESALAFQQVQALPSQAQMDDASKVNIGRIFVKHGVSGDANALAKGVRLLDHAQPDDDLHADHLYWLAKGKEALGVTEEAAQSYEDYLARFELLTEHHVLEAVLGYGRTSLSLGKSDQAVTFLEHNRAKFPGSLDLTSLLADAYLSEGDREKAFEIAKAAVAFNPVSMEAHKLLSKTAEALGDIRTAIDSEQKVLSQEPDAGAHWVRLAELYALIKDHPATREHLARALLLDRDDTQALKRFAKLASSLGWYATQKRLLRHAAVRAPEDLGLNHELAELAEESGDYETASSAWQRYLDHAPDDLAVIKRAAAVVARTGRQAAAIELWQRVAEKDPEDTESLLSLAKMYEWQGETQISLQYYQQLLDAGTEDPQVLAACAKALLEFGEPERARVIIERAVHQFPEHERLRLAEVESLLESGKAEQALTLMESLAKRSPADAYSLGLAAKCAVMIGDVPKAKAGLDEALHQTYLAPEASLVLLEVCAALGEWRIHATLLRGLIHLLDKLEPESRIALRAILRTRDLEWLHAEICGVRKNKPDPKAIKHGYAAWHELTQETEQLAKTFLAPFVKWDESFESPDREVDIVLDKLSNAERQELIQSLAMGQLKANRPNKALNLLDENAPSAAYQGYHALLTAVAAMKIGQIARAKDAAEIAAKSINTRACASYLSGKIGLLESNPTVAITAFNAALALYADEAVWHAELAQIYAQDDRQEAAIPHLQQAVELEPRNAEYLLALARAYRAAGELSQSEATYTRCLQAPSPSAQVWKEAGEVALANGHGPQAESWFETACGLAPSDAICLMGSARAALLMGQQKTALHRAQTAYKIAPNEPEVLTGYAEVLAAQGKTDKALQAYDRAIKVSAGDRHIQLARSRLLLKSGQYSDAINDIRAVLTEDDNNADAWALLAESHEGVSDLNKALEAIKRALDHSPRTGDYRLAQGRIYRKSGQLDQALKVLRELETDEPENPTLPGELGRVYEARRETDAALQAYLRAVSLNPKDIESCMQAGLILKGLKSYENAAEMFEHVVAARPHDAKALHQLAAVRALQLVHGGIETQVVTP